MQSANRFPIDGDNALRVTGSAAVVTATTTDSAVQELLSDAAYWQAGKNNVRDGEVEVAIKVLSIGTGDGALKFEIVSCEDAAKTNAKVFAEYPVNNVGRVEIEVDGFAIKAQHSAATHWFLRATTTVGTGAVNAAWEAYIAPDA